VNRPPQTRVPDQRPRVTDPVRIGGPGGPWHPVRAGLALHGNAVVHTTRSDWAATRLTDTALRRLLGGDWPRYHRTADPVVRDRFLASRLALKHTAAAVVGTDPAELDLAYKPGGRPYLRGLDQIDIGLTHTGDVIAVGISRIGRIGVDVEPAGRRMDFRLLHRQVCTPAEYAALAGLPEPDRSAELLRLWTLKEAYTKALGQGLRLGFTEFGFGGGQLRTPGGHPAAGADWAFATYPVPGHHVLSVACHDEGLRPSPDTAARTMLDEAFCAAATERP
jgi:4'-phosphopantetheinyl transferase